MLPDRLSWDKSALKALLLGKGFIPPFPGSKEASAARQIFLPRRAPTLLAKV